MSFVFTSNMVKLKELGGLIIIELIVSPMHHLFTMALCYKFLACFSCILCLHAGRPSVPALSVGVVKNFHTFVFTITPPLLFSQCILNYVIIPTKRTSAGIFTGLPDITVYTNGGGRDLPITYARGGFDLCSNSYFFSVMSRTLAYTGERTQVIGPFPDLSKLLRNPS